MDVPIPCATKPPTPLSLKLITANPIIWAQHPTVAAPAANPPSPNIIQSAALDMGAVKANPTTTATIIPMINGLISVAFIMIWPNPVINASTTGPNTVADIIPAINVIAGVTNISTLVSLDTSFPNSAPKAAARNAPAGPPNWAPIIPVMALAKSTSGGAFNPQATATPTPAPINPMAIVPVSTKKADTVFSPNNRAVCSPRVLMIRPINNEANNPRAMALNAS